MTRPDLPQLAGGIFLTDSGLETELLFNQGVDLPEFAAFPLLGDTLGQHRLRAYFAEHAAIAARAGVGFIFEAPTWRANADWGALLGFDAEALDEVNRQAIELLVELRADLDGPRRSHPISGCIGPRADAYRPARLMSAAEAADYHARQITTFAGTEADLITAMTLNYADEAIGIALAARASGLPAVLSFTVETDGQMPDGTSLADAISAVDDATGAYPSYYMINCAHPTHFAATLDTDADRLTRLSGIRANASRRSHAELDDATALDAGDPVEFGQHYARLRSQFPNLTVLGGCCGTDRRHIEQIAAACL